MKCPECGFPEREGPEKCWRYDVTIPCRRESEDGWRGPRRDASKRLALFDPKNIRRPS